MLFVTNTSEKYSDVCIFGSSLWEKLISLPEKPSTLKTQVVNSLTWLAIRPFRQMRPDIKHATWQPICDQFLKQQIGNVSYLYVDICTGLQEQADHVDTAVRDGQHQGRLAMLSGRKQGQRESTPCSTAGQKRR